MIFACGSFVVSITRESDSIAPTQKHAYKLSAILCKDSFSKQKTVHLLMDGFSVAGAGLEPAASGLPNT